MIRTIIAATLASSALAVSAAAEDTVVIDVAGVDFTDPAQAADVYDQVVDASEAVCEDIYLARPERGVSYFSLRRMYEQCVTDTVETAIASTTPSTHERLLAAKDGSAFAVASN